MIVLFLAGCGGMKNFDAKSVVLADVNGDKVTLEEMYKSPVFNKILEQIIYERVITQEHAARNLKLDDLKLQAKWDDFVKAQGGDEAKALEMLKAQGANKDIVLNSFKMQMMLEGIINQDKPITMEAARKEFESNLQANQRMYASEVPAKKDNPETITFEDVANKVIENMQQRQFSTEGQNTLTTLYNKYVENGWITNYVKPVEMKDLTKIEKPKPERVDEDPSKMRRVPLRGGNKDTGGQQPPAGENDQSQNNK